MSFESCIRDAQARDEITPDDAEAILYRHRANRMSMPPLRARDELAKMLAIAGAEKRRRGLLAAKAKENLVKNVFAYRTPSGGHDLIEAMYSLWEGFGHAGYAGVREIQEATIGLMHAKMADVLDTFRRTGISGRRTSGAVASDILHPSELRKRMQTSVSMADLRRASFGEKSTPKAEALYGSFAEASEWARQKYNELGGAIPKLERWGLPQVHDSAAVARAFGHKDAAASRAAWVSYIKPSLNWHEMFDALTGEKFGQVGHNGGPPMEINEDRKDAILGHIWDTIVTNGSINLTPSMQPKGQGSIATQRMDHRFLIFKSAQHASEYNRQFGSGDEFTQMMGHLHSMAGDIALMEQFGPNPAAMLNYTKEILEKEAAIAATGGPHRLRGVTRFTAESKVKQANKILDGFYEQYRGDRPGETPLALWGTIARNVVTSALLGSSAIPHAASNWFIQTMARYAGGIPYFRVIPQLMRAFGRTSHEEMLRAGLDIDNGMFHVGSGAKQLGKLQKIANWSKWLPDRTTHWFGLVPIVEANKGSFHRGMMATLADLQKTDWKNLPDRIRSKMRGYGLRERDWRVMQTAQLYEPAIGSAKWLRSIDVMDAGDAGNAARHEQILQAYGRTSLDPTNDAKEAQRIAEAVGRQMLAYMHGEREVAVPSHSMRAAARIVGTADQNTWWGQFRKSFGLFKGFIGGFMVSQLHTIWSEMARGRWRGAAYATALVTGMTAGGLLSLQLKQMSAGKDPAPMNPATKSGFVTWLRAALTGGSFGIFGDFLASAHSSFGMGPLETLAGPVAEWPLSAAEGTIDEIKNRFAGTTREPLTTTLANSALKFARANTPFLSTGWYTRAAFNRILDSIARSYDRNAVHKQRMQEQRLRQDTGQHFWWRPGEMAPERLPALTPSR